MAYKDMQLARAYQRTQQTKRRLAKAIAEGEPAKKIAHLQGMYDRHKQEYTAIKLKTMKI